jgi:hypothetical protein
MKAYVERIIENPQRSLRGPMLGLNLEFVSRHGMPVFWFDEDDTAKLSNARVEEAAPGMVGVGFYDELLYTVLADGTASALPLQVINVVNEYPTQPRRTSEQTNQLRGAQQQA